MQAEPLPVVLRVALCRSFPAGAPALRYASAGAAGLDLCAWLESPLQLQPGQTAAVATGLAVAIPAGFEGQVRPRSGLARRHGVTVLNAPGTIDSDYRGEIEVLLVHHGAAACTIEPGERIAQLVIAPVVQAQVEWLPTVQALGSTERGAGGFGSTGR